MVYNDVMLIYMYLNHTATDRSKQVDYKIQKAKIHDSLQQSLKKGDTWYMFAVFRYNIMSQVLAIFINPLRMRSRVTVVCLSVCMSVCLSVC